MILYNFVILILGTNLLLNTQVYSFRCSHKLQLYNKQVEKNILKSYLQMSTGNDNTISSTQTELPNDFSDAINRCTMKTIDFIRSGGKRCRIDFDTSIGDVTYTSLKNTMPVLKEIVKSICIQMDLSIPSPALLNNTVIRTPEDELLLLNNQSSIEKFVITKSIKLFFPDMGAAALTRRDWKMGGPFHEVPECVYTANIQNDELSNTDKIVIFVCPLYSEADYVKRVLDMCDDKNIPCIMLNADLINMDQGFGVRARNIRKTLLSTFITTYKLKTLSQGAVVREWPNKFTVWKEGCSDHKSQAEGYFALQSFSTDPTREEIEELFNENIVSDMSPNNPISNTINEVMGFFKGMSRL